MAVSTTPIDWRTRFTLLLNRLTEPSAQITLPSEHRRARLLCRLLLFLLVMVGISAFYIDLKASLMALIMISGAYALSRTRHYQWGVLIAVFALMIPSFMITINVPSAQLNDAGAAALPLIWLILGLILSSLWANAWITAVVSIVGVTLVLGLHVMRPGINALGINSIAAQLGVSGGLLVLAAALRNRDLREIALQTTILEKQQQELKLSADRYRSLVDNITDVVYTIDTEGYFTYVSASAEASIGYPASKLVGMHFTELVDPAWRTTVKGFYFYQLQKPQAETSLEFPITTPTQNIWVEQKVTPVFDHDHKLTGFQGVVRDVTQRRDAEEKLRISEINLRTILDNSPAIIAKVNREALVEFIRVPGAEPALTEPFVGQSILGFVSEEYHPTVQKAIRTVFDSKQTLGYETTGISPGDGTKHSYMTQAAPIVEDDEVVSVLLVVSDITELKQTSAALEQQRMFLRQVIDFSPSMIFVKDYEGRFVLANPIVANLYKVPADALIGKTDADFNVNAHEVRKFIRDDQDVIASGQPSFFEEPVTDAQGGKHWFQTTKVPIISAVGESKYVLGVSTDVTAYKQAEHQIQTQNESLVRANRDLAIARKQAEAASKLKSQFLATMSHELRTPLNAIIGYAQLQLAGMIGEMNEEQQEFQERILVNSQHLLGLINEVLDLSKIEAGRMELSEKPFNVRECLDEIMLQNRVLAENKQLSFALTVDEALPENVIGDRGRVKQIIINLVSNAIKFTDQGSVTVDAALHSKESWRVKVTDTGTGISATMQETIFDEFRQAENGIDRGGTGLGLAIVRKLVLMMGGNIRLSSELGAGSVFTVIFPLLGQAQSKQDVLEQERSDKA